VKAFLLFDSKWAIAQQDGADDRESML